MSKNFSSKDLLIVSHSSDQLCHELFKLHIRKKFFSAFLANLFIFIWTNTYCKPDDVLKSNYWDGNIDWSLSIESENKRVQIFSYLDYPAAKTLKVLNLLNVSDIFDICVVSFVYALSQKNELMNMCVVLLLLIIWFLPAIVDRSSHRDDCI